MGNGNSKLEPSTYWCCATQAAKPGEENCGANLIGYNTSDCDGYMIDFCSKDDRIANNDNCKHWASKHKDAAKNISIAHCSWGNNMNTDFCKNYCAENKGACKQSKLEYCERDNNMTTDICKTFCAENQGTCDLAAIDYCSRNPDDTDFCGCMNIPDNLKALSKSGLAIKPQCNLQQCIKASAYKTNAMLNDKSCPTLNVCDQKINIGGLDKGQLSGITFSCGQDTDTDTQSTEDDTSSEVNNDSSSTDINIFKSNSSIIVAVVMVLLLLILSSGFTYIMSSK